jgi:hypothetical protein
MRQSGSHLTAAGSSAVSSQQDNEQAGVGIYFVKNDIDGRFFVQHILPGYSAEKCGSILTGDIVTHVGAFKLPPDLTLDKLRPMIVRLKRAQHHIGTIRRANFTQSAGWASGNHRNSHVSTRVRVR